jgi:hypothetical protein
MTLRGAKRFAMARTNFGTSAQPFDKVMNVVKSSPYSLQTPITSHVTSQSDAIDEPSTDDVVPLLEALPPEEREF